MELDDLKALVTNYESLKDAIMREKVFIFGEAIEKDFDLRVSQYNIHTHPIYDTAKRPDKVVQNGDATFSVPVARIPIPYQKKIVQLATTFLLGNPVELSAKPITQVETDMFNTLVKIWEDNKLDYEGAALTEAVLSMTEAAELWYTEPVSDDYWNGTPMQGVKFKLRYMLLSRSPLDSSVGNVSTGDTLYPVFNSKRDLIAFGRRYMSRENNEPVEHFDIYTDAVIYLSFKPTANSDWTVKEEPNMLGKIPVVYYYKPHTDWHDVQPMIERYEKSISNHADDNDYSGSPLLIIKGKINSFAKKGEAGKVLELDNGADASYLQPASAPESIKLEQDNLKDLIHDMSDTPHISFEEVQGIGKLSGIALKLLFMGAHMKAAKNETIIGKGFQRRINFLKTALSRLNTKLAPALALSVKPVFEYYIPKDDEAYVNMLNVATGGQPTLSQKTALTLSPLVSDPDAEMEDIKTEGLDSLMNDILPPAKPKPAPAPAPVK